MDIARKTAYHPKKVKPKKGLTFKNKVPTEAPELVSFGGKGEVSAPV